MSTTSKYIIPLLSKELILDDIDPKNGFIDAYTCDKNKPYLDHHIFLVYKINAGKIDAFYRNKRLSNNDSLYCRYTYTINGEEYIVYVFPIISKAISYALDGHLCLSKNESLRLLEFWKGTDKDINHYFLNPFQAFIPKYALMIPERDFILDVDTLLV